MTMFSLMPSFLEELSKIASSMAFSPTPKYRSSRRPIRAHNYLQKDFSLAFKRPQKETTMDMMDDLSGIEGEVGSGFAESGMANSRG